MGEILMSIAAWRRSTFVVVIFASLAACSVADYEKPVSDFAGATNNAAEALVVLDTQITESYAAVLRARVLSDKLLVKFDEGDCLVTSERCRLVAVNRDNQKEPLTPKDMIGRMVALMGSVRAYAQNLGAIVQADTAAQAATHVNAALGSVKNLSATVVSFGGKGGADISDYTTAAGKFVNWAIGQYVAKVKLDALREATTKAHPVIEEASRIFEDTAGLIALVPKGELSSEVEKSFQAFDDASNESNLENLIAKADAYDQFLRTKPATVFAQLREAHGALAAKLKNDDLSLSNVSAKIEAFVVEAKTLLSIVRELRDAGKK